MKAKLKSYEFWVSIVSAVMVVLQSLSLKFDLPYIQEVVMGFLGILAVAGIVKKNDPPAGESTTAENTSEITATTEDEVKENDEDIIK